MSVTVKVFGYSDDNVEVEGGGLDDEFGSYNHATYLHFNDGTVLRVEYDPKDYRGRWQVQVAKQGTAAIEIKPAPKDDEDNYTDVATLTGEITSVECWRSMTPSRDDILERLKNEDFRGLSASTESLLQAWRLISGDK